MEWFKKLNLLIVSIVNMLSENLINLIRSMWYNVAWWLYASKHIFREYLVDFQEAYWDYDEKFAEDFMRRIDNKFEEQSHDEIDDAI